MRDTKRLPVPRRCGTHTPVLVITLAFPLKPSTTPLENCPRARNQFRIRSRCERNHAGNLLHRVEPRAHRPGAPAVEELAGPVRRHVAPQRLKVLLEQVGANRAQVATHQLRKPAPLLAGELLRTLEQEPAAALEHRRPPLGGELPGVWEWVLVRQEPGRSCAQPASRPSAPRSGGGAERRALTAASTRARCGSDEDYQPSVLPTDSAEDPHMRRVRLFFVGGPRASASGPARAT